MIVRVTPHTPCDGYALVLAQEMGHTDIVERFDLQHEMPQPLRRIGHGHECQGMVPWIAVEESHTASPCHPRELDKIADAHPQHVTVKVQAFVNIIHAQNDV